MTSLRIFLVKPNQPLLKKRSFHLKKLAAATKVSLTLYSTSQALALNGGNQFCHHKTGEVNLFCCQEKRIKLWCQTGQ